MGLDDALAEVDRLVDAFVAREPVPGVAYGVIVDGELVHARGVGTASTTTETPPTPDTVFRIASMTKSFTAAAVLLLRDEDASTSTTRSQPTCPRCKDGARPTPARRRSRSGTC